VWRGPVPAVSSRSDWCHSRRPSTGWCALWVV